VVAEGDLTLVAVKFGRFSVSLGLLVLIQLGRRHLARLGAKGKVIEGFSKADCQAITTGSIRHVLRWKGEKDCHLIQALPIRLRFYLKKAKLYSFTPRIRHKHYVQSYD
jgi:hypothetical protein